MKGSDKFGRIEDWIRIAKTDWHRVKRNIKENDVVVAGFYLQQCVEKFIKAFLLLHGWELKKIHELDALLDEAIKHKPELTDFYELCERVTGYYLAERYPPFDDLGITVEVLEKDLFEVKKLVKILFPEVELNG